VKNRIPKNSHKLLGDTPEIFPHPIPGGGQTEGGDLIRKTQQRYCTLALTMAILAGTVLMFFGYTAWGKGLILGSLFSILNFILMAMALPVRLGKGRGKSSLFSFSSIFLRYAILALPLIWALRQETIAVSTVALGLFMVQVAILGDHLWARLRNPLEAG
jgi:hypothetical protein